MSLNAIGCKYLLDVKTISSYCNKYDIVIPTPIYKVDWESIDLVALLETYTITEIASQLDITPGGIRARLRKLHNLNIVNK